LTIRVKTQHTPDNTITFSLIPMLDYTHDLRAEALLIFEKMGIPAIDWEIKNRAQGLGFESTEDMMGQAGELIMKSNLDKLETLKGGIKFYLVSKLFKLKS